MLGSWTTSRSSERGYYALLLVLTTGMIGVFIALDLFLFYVMWEVMLIPMYFIIGIWGGEQPALRRHQVLHLHDGRLAADAGGDPRDGLRSWRRGTGDTLVRLRPPAARTRDLLAPCAPWLFGAFALAFAIKVPMFPFHTWLPDAHVEAPTAGSVVLAGDPAQDGHLRLPAVRGAVLPGGGAEPGGARRSFVALAVIGIVYGALVAMVQPDFKKLVAYSSVSHLGFVMLGIWARHACRACRAR